MDAKVSTKTKTKTFQNLNKNYPLVFKAPMLKASKALQKPTGTKKFKSRLFHQYS